MDDPKDQHLGALEELKSFLKNFEFISAAFYKSLYHHFSELEDEFGRLLDGFNALSSLENTLGAALTKDDAIGEDVVVALYDLVKTFESLFHGKRIKEMLKHQAHQEAAEFAAKGEAERAATIKDKEIAEMAAKGAGEYTPSSRFGEKIKDLRDRVKNHLHTGKTESSVWRFPVLNDFQSLILKHPNYVITKNFLIEKISPDNYKEAISRISTLNTLLEKACNLPTLPTGYRSIEKLQNLDKYNVEISEIYPKAMGNSYEGHKNKGSDVKATNRLLFVTGESGCGKTNFLLQLTRLFLMERYKFSTNHQVVAHFCDKGDTVEDCVSSVVRQFRWLAHCNPYHPQLPATQDTQFSTNARKFDTMRDILYDTLKQGIEPTFVVIDGLDECRDPDGGTGTNLAGLFGLISETMQRSPNIHWIVSARTINKQLFGTRAYEVINMNEDKPQRLVARFVSLQVDTFFERSGIDEDSRRVLEERIRDQSGYNLLWIKLACSIIRKDPKNAFQITDNLGDQIEDLYALGYETLKLKSEDYQHNKEILTVMAAAYGPLAISELQSFLEVPDAINLKGIIRRRLFLFLEVRDDVVYFTHSSGKEFLAKHYTGQVARETHVKIAVQCLKMLESSDYGGEVTDQLGTRYAASYWAKHVLCSQLATDDNHTQRIGLDVALMKFLNNSFSQRLSAAKKNLYPVSGAIQDLLKFRDYLTGLEQKPNSFQYLIPDAIDAVQFHLFHGNVGNVNPKDSLLFYPSERIRRSLLKKEYPQLLNVPATEYNSNDMTLNLRHSKEVVCIAYSPDGCFVASASRDNTVRIWNASDGTQIGMLKRFDVIGVRCIVFSDSGILATLSDSGDVDIWDFHTHTFVKKIRKEILQPKDQKVKFRDLAFSPDGRELAVATQKCVSIWSLPHILMERSFSPNDGAINCLKFLNDISIATASSKVIYIWCSTTGRVTHTLLGHTMDITSLAISPNRQRLASGSVDKTIRVWDAKSLKLLYTLEGHENAVTSISFSFDGAKLASATRSQVIKIWDFDSKGLVPNNLTVRNSETVVSVQFSPKDNRLASALCHGNEGTVRIWDAYALQQAMNDSVTQTNRHTCAVTCLKFSHNGKFIVSASRDGKICIWDGETGQYRATLEGPCECPTWLSISPDDQSLASSSNDGTVMIWNTATWSPRQKLIGHRDQVSCAVFSPDGKYIASGSFDKTVRVWELHKAANDHEIKETKKALELSCDKDKVVSVAFSSDCKQLASSASNGSVIRVWNMQSEDISANVEKLPQEESFLSHRIFFSSDGNFIIASGHDHLSLWDIQSQKRIRTMQYKLALFQSIKLDDKHPRYIFTEAGPILLCEEFEFEPLSKSQNGPFWKSRLSWKPEIIPKLESYSCTLKLDGSGINWKDKCLVEFPKRYHPVSNGAFTASVHGTKVAAGYESGLVTLFKFAEGEDEGTSAM